MPIREAKFKILKAPYVIALDISGTCIRGGICYKDNNGEIAYESAREIGTPIYKNEGNDNFKKYLEGEFLDAIIDVINASFSYMQTEMTVTKAPIGISFSGQIGNDGKIHSASSIFKGQTPDKFNIKDEIKKKYPDSEIYVLNNVSAAAWNYSIDKEFETSEKFLLIHIGSGFGSKIFDNNRKEVVIDKEGLAGELGHIHIEKDKIFTQNKLIFECDCGKENHLAAFILKNGILNLFTYYSCCDVKKNNNKKKESIKRTIDELIKLKPMNDILNQDIECSKKIFTTISKILGKIISYFVLVIGIDKVIIKGSQFYGLSMELKKYFQKELVNHINEYPEGCNKKEEFFIHIDFLLEDDDRRISLKGMYIYINNSFLSSYEVTNGYAHCDVPSVELTYKKDVTYTIFKTEHLFDKRNSLLKDIIGIRETLFIIDKNYNKTHNKKLSKAIRAYLPTSKIIEISPKDDNEGEKKTLKQVYSRVFEK
ncbi:MAG: ROK family protein [Candidatus Magnetobacterium sp. LHC-1]